MKNQERKILVEVSPEEYEKIKAGALEADVPTYEQVKKDLLKNMSEEDVEALLKAHPSTILKNILDGDLVAEIINRSQTKNLPKFIRDPVSTGEYSVRSGELGHIKRKDFAQKDEPVIETDDVFIWTLQISEKIL